MQPSLAPPDGWTCPLDDSYLQMINQAIALEQHHMYNLQQAELCNLDCQRLKADSERRMQFLVLVKAHFFAGCP